MSDTSTIWIDVGSPMEIAQDECKVIEYHDTAIAVFNLDGEFFAIKDDCPHQHMPLADGMVENGCITCPFHGARFDLRTGDFLAPPACENLTTYPTQIIDGRIQIQITEE